MGEGEREKDGLELNASHFSPQILLGKPLHHKRH